MTDWYTNENAGRLVQQYIDGNELSSHYWCKQLNLAFEKGQQIGREEAAEAISGLQTELIQSEQAAEAQWMERPSGPGLWVCIGKGRLNGQDTVLKLSQHDLDRGSPFETKMVYGPIPEVTNSDSA